MTSDSHTTSDRSETGERPTTTIREIAFSYLGITVYSLMAVLGLSLLVVGTVAIIAELKGTWHWQIHLQSTISYVGVFVAALVVVLVPLYTIFLGWRLKRG